MVLVLSKWERARFEKSGVGDVIWSSECSIRGAKIYANV